MKVYLIRHGATKGNLEHRYVGRTEEALLPEAEEALLALKERLEMLHLQENGEEEKTAKEASGENAALGKNGCRKWHLFVSPMLRCLQSAEILFPGKEPTVVDDFRECDFGEFEYKNYEELDGNVDYQRFLDSMGEDPFPGGESKKEFSERCSRAFEKEIRKLLLEERNLRKEQSLQEKRGCQEELYLREKRGCQEELSPQEKNERQEETHLQEKNRALETPEIQEIQETFLIVHGGTIMAVLDRFSEPHRDYYDWQIRNGEGFQAEVREVPGSGEIRLKEIRRI